MNMTYLFACIGMFALLITMVTQSAQAEEFNNPLIEQCADPWIYKHTDDFYYFTATVPEYDRLEIRRAKTIQALADAEPKVIWRKHESGPMGSHIWAPEIHSIEGKWYIYFAAGGAEKIWDIRMYVLENASPNPLEGGWIEKGQVKTGWESFSLDATTFEHKGTRYLVWAQKDPHIYGNTNLYIAKMDTPWSITGKQMMLTKPEFHWEKILFWVNEGAAVITRNGKIFLTYSASGTDANYCMGMLTADENSHLLDPASWTKSKIPVFKSSEANGQYGPGHNSFTVSADGSKDILVYHARNYEKIAGDPLHDPNRHTRVQAFGWNHDGTPDFGKPLPDGPIR
jgi:GH43 family beta-xylosidase